MSDKKTEMVVSDGGQQDQLLAVIERIASNPEADIGKLEKMLDMQERILNRNAEMAFSAAMAEMQADLPTIKKNGAIVVNGEVRSTFARFEDINDQVKPIMQKYGFAMTFKTNTNDGQVIVVGGLVHREGHRESTDIVLPVDVSGSKNPVQAIGSSVSYGKRYVMCALLNITTSEDDDGAGTVEKLSPEQVKEIRASLRKTASEEAGLVSYLSGGMWSKLEETPASMYDRAISVLKAKEKKSA